MSDPKPPGEKARIEEIIERRRREASGTPEAPPVIPKDATESTSLPKLPRRRIPRQHAQAEAVQQLVETKPVSYYTPELIQCTLPHSDPGQPIWVKKNGDFSLVVTSGGDESGAFFGIPYGSFPRLVLAHIITQVVSTRQRRIELTSHFGTFLKEVGYVGNHKGQSLAGRRTRDQLLRLLNANIAFRYRETAGQTERKAAAQMHVAPRYDLWWDFKSPEQGSLFGSWIEISEDFYQAILNNPVPLRTDVLKVLKKSPLAIDVYMWLSYRLFAMNAKGERERFVPFGALQAQFGTGISEENYRKFRQELKGAFTKVAALWHHGDDNSLLKYEFVEGGLVLHRGPLLVARGSRTTDQEEAAAILERRQFDADTIVKARIKAGKQYDVYQLQTAYFAWITEEGITVQNPRAHFLNFIETHRKKNG